LRRSRRNSHRRPRPSHRQRAVRRHRRPPPRAPHGPRRPEDLAIAASSPAAASQNALCRQAVIPREARDLLAWLRAFLQSTGFHGIVCKWLLEEKSVDPSWLGSESSFESSLSLERSTMIPATITSANARAHDGVLPDIAVLLPSWIAAKPGSGRLPSACASIKVFRVGL